jgi:hypothetical protein
MQQPADYKSAIQQIENLRYGGGGGRLHRGQTKGAVSAFGFRTSFGFRVSGFGFHHLCR